jgi:hypothetical protein
MQLQPDHSGATFSNCGTYRYSLWRTWDPSKPVATFIMLNPSTADEVDNDPTVERCQRRALQMDYGGLRVVNIFALRSPKPALLYTQSDPIGPDNDLAIQLAVQDAGIVICAWGGHSKHLNRGASVIAMLNTMGAKPTYLKLNKDGTPQHPLYVAYKVMPTPFDAAHKIQALQTA